MIEKSDLLALFKQSDSSDLRRMCVAVLDNFLSVERIRNLATSLRAFSSHTDPRAKAEMIVKLAWRRFAGRKAERDELSKIIKDVSKPKPRRRPSAGKERPPSPDASASNMPSLRLAHDTRPPPAVLLTAALGCESGEGVRPSQCGAGAEPTSVLERLAAQLERLERKQDAMQAHLATLIEQSLPAPTMADVLQVRQPVSPRAAPSVRGHPRANVFPRSPQSDLFTRQ
uniref:Uncharacterized protein n=1 Tax=Haptolina ericina TaxID=156174 RepID=A0A7S3AWV0_9EUKA